MKENPVIWEAWIGQKIVRMESMGDATVIVLEDGRGVKLWADGFQLHFNLTNTDGPLWAE